MKKTILGIYIFLNNIGLAYVNIYPLNFDKSAEGKGSTETYKLYNGTDKTIRYRIYLEDGENPEKSMKEWIEYYPNILTIKPRQEEEIKVLVRAPKESSKGEYTAILGVKEIAIPNEEEMKKGIKGGVQILTNLKMEIASYVGEIKPKIKISDLELKKNETELKFTGIAKNVGERRGGFQFFLSDRREKNIYPLGEYRILKGRELNLDVLTIKKIDKHLKEKIEDMNVLLVKDVESGKELTKIQLN